MRSPGSTADELRPARSRLFRVGAENARSAAAATASGIMERNCQYPLQPVPPGAEISRPQQHPSRDRHEARITSGRATARLTPRRAVLADGQRRQPGAGRPTETNSQAAGERLTG